MRYGYLALCAMLLVAESGCCCRMSHVLSGVTSGPPVQAHVTAQMTNTAKLEPLCQWVVASGPNADHCAKVALIDVDGLLVNAGLGGPYSEGENPVAVFREKLAVVESDPNIVAAVLRINTAGGGAAATEMMFREVMDFRARTGLPVIACLMELGTGGGYYLATAADVIFAYPTTIVGGIGVIFNHYDLGDAMAQQNVLHNPIKAGKYIDMGSSAGPLPEEAREWLEKMAGEYHHQFKSVVLTRRPHVVADDETTFDGRVFTAREALKRGLIDRVGGLEDALDAARSLAPCGDASVVMFHRPSDPARTPFDVTRNAAVLGQIIPLSFPGFDRSKMPRFLYLWQVEPTLEKVAAQ